MNDYEDDYEDLTPEPRLGRSRRDRLNDEMPDYKLRKKLDRPIFKSKPKGFRHDRRRNQKDGY